MFNLIRLVILAEPADDPANHHGVSFPGRVARPLDLRPSRRAAMLAICLTLSSRIICMTCWRASSCSRPSALEAEQPMMAHLGDFL